MVLQSADRRRGKPSAVQRGVPRQAPRWLFPLTESDAIPPRLAARVVLHHAQCLASTELIDLQRQGELFPARLLSDS